MDDDCFDESLHESPIKTRYEVEQTLIAEKNQLFGDTPNDTPNDRREVKQAAQ